MKHLLLASQIYAATLGNTLLLAVTHMQVLLNTRAKLEYADPWTLGRKQGVLAL